jgi:hypothetical protein
MRKRLNRWAAAQMSKTSPLGRTLASHEKAGFEKAGMSREKDAGLPEGIFLLKESQNRDIGSADAAPKASGTLVLIDWLARGGWSTRSRKKSACFGLIQVKIEL